jgi:hypothetical protein
MVGDGSPVREFHEDAADGIPLEKYNGRAGHLGSGSDPSKTCRRWSAT